MNPGETLWSIAQTCFGDGQWWRRVSQVLVGSIAEVPLRLQSPFNTVVTVAFLSVIGRLYICIPFSDRSRGRLLDSPQLQVSLDPGGSLVFSAASGLTDVRWLEDAGFVLSMVALASLPATVSIAIHRNMRMPGTWCSALRRMREDSLGGIMAVDEGHPLGEAGRKGCCTDASAAYRPPPAPTRT